MNTTSLETREALPLLRGVCCFVCLLSSLFFLFACSSNSQSGASLEVNWESVPQDSTALLLQNRDSLGNVTTDTLWLSEGSGSLKRHFPLVTTTEAYLTPLVGGWAFVVRLIPHQEVQVDLNFLYPHLHTARGYPSADLRRSFIRKQKELIQELDEIALRLQRGGRNLQPKERKRLAEEQRRLWKNLQTEAAHFIVAHKDEPGIDTLAQEYFPSFEGAVAFDRLYPNEALPMNLLRLENYREQWKAQKQAQEWKDVALFPMSDTLRMRWNKRDSLTRGMLIVITDSLWKESDLHAFYRLLRTDSLSRSLLFLSLCKEEGSFTRRVDTTFRHSSWSDSLQLLPHYHEVALSVEHLHFMQRHWGVEQYPYFLLINDKEKILYRGGQWKKLLGEVRRLSLPQ